MLDTLFQFVWESLPSYTRRDTTWALQQKVLKPPYTQLDKEVLICRHRNKFSRFSIPLALSRGILLRPKSGRVETELSWFVSLKACRFVYILANRRP